jgi:hypothetical protein
MWVELPAKSVEPFLIFQVLLKFIDDGSVLLHLHILTNSPNFLLSCISHLIPLGLETMHYRPFRCIELVLRLCMVWVGARSVCLRRKTLPLCKMLVVVCEVSLASRLVPAIQFLANACLVLYLRNCRNKYAVLLSSCVILLQALRQICDLLLLYVSRNYRNELSIMSKVFKKFYINCISGWTI